MYTIVDKRSPVTRVKEVKIILGVRGLPVVSVYVTNVKRLNSAMDTRKKPSLLALKNAAALTYAVSFLTE